MLDRFTIDFETFYDRDYSLKKMTPVEYILDSRFEAIMLSVKRPNKKVFNLSGDKIEKFFSVLEPDRTVMITYNALFDQCIAAWKYSFIPVLMIDAMGMVRAWHGHELRSVALAYVAPFLGVGFKGEEALKMSGLHEVDIRAMGLWDQYVTYCGNDSELTEAIFNKIMADGFPVSELLVMHQILMMAVNPQFELNGSELAVHLQDIITDKANLLAASGLNYDNNGKCPELMSNEKFAGLLIAQGVDPPTKISPTTGRETYAFSKADQEFTDLEDHPSLAVQALMTARLGHKSTIEETRTQRFLNIANLQWPGGKSLAPMPLRYGAAHTHRFGGDWKLNPQNFPSRGKINHLKKALVAPPGHQVLNVDSSQIEARIVAWLAGEWELLSQFAKGLDPYKIFAAKVFGVLPEQVTPEQRFLGKTSILGLGYGLGWIKFKHQVRVKSLEALKLSGQGRELILPDEASIKIVNTYRTTYPGVQNLWRSLNAAISILAGYDGGYSIGPCTFSKGRISLPSGLHLHYHNLRQTSDGWLYDHSGKPRRLYGGALLENIVQALARCIVMDAALRIAPRIRLQLALQVHDALVYVAPDELVTHIGNIAREEMNRQVTWAPELPLACELKSGPTYGDAK